MVRVILLGLLLIIAARIFWRVVDAVIEGATGEPRRRVRSGERLQRDPVCGTYVAPRAALTASASGSTVYFCSEKCRDEYLAR